MSAVTAEARVRRPKSKETLVRLLMQESGDGPFKRLADVLLFAAALGWSRQRQEPFMDAEEPIRYEVFLRSGTAEAFIDSIAAITFADDPMILSEDRIVDRIGLFEEYANGGLSELQKELNTGQRTVTEVLLSLVRDAGQESDEDADLPPEIERFLGPAQWSS